MPRMWVGTDDAALGWERNFGYCSEVRVSMEWFPDTDAFNTTYNTGRF